ncbi:MAG: CDP-diacylglycerol--glycerol-3-phosphate 3-phosphatidyltransferase [Chlamydiales bacterium]|nr:CDP-diacylglycerol--glycerol-3-phosphate 3-phosphatidyltransferase [Chlamydiales bacterium]MCH9619715.1 CDP-diacylglycerol--glycerol-3-phosphate 3-phosphatidyltransferase [Chlamydiales bacterium]MCH9623321.1 CDP-diacylglycerol--glycerol-3-phosphate 3-phosphatidyltransferase [Chlamydiales bacterium]
MLNVSNVLSLSRAGFALAFLQENIAIRLLAIALAMISDFLDGYLARLQKTTTSFGAILDPIMDKFFVFFVGGVLYLENRLLSWELGALISRDISICLFGLFLGLVRGWKGYECKALWWGKITTAAQFFLLLGLTLNFIFPGYVYLIFVIMATFAFVELLLRYRVNNNAVK